MKMVLKVGVYGGAAALLGAALAVDFTGDGGRETAEAEEKAGLLADGHRALGELLAAEVMMDGDRWAALRPEERRAARDAWEDANQGTVAAIDSLAREVDAFMLEKHLAAMRENMDSQGERLAESAAEELDSMKWALFERLGAEGTAEGRRAAVDAWSVRNRRAIAAAEREEVTLQQAELASELAARLAWEAPDGVTVAEEAYLTLRQEMFDALGEEAFGDPSIGAEQRRMRVDEVSNGYRPQLEYLIREVEAER